MFLLVVTAACSSTQSDKTGGSDPVGSISPAGSTQSAGSTGLAAFEAAAKATIEKYTTPQTTPPPTDGPRAVPGKRIAFVTITEAEPAALTVLKNMQQAASVLGWKQTTYNANGSATDANKFMQQAVTTHPDAIVVLGLDNTATGAGLAAAG